MNFNIHTQSYKPSLTLRPTIMEKINLTMNFISYTQLRIEINLNFLTQYYVKMTLIMNLISSTLSVLFDFLTRYDHKIN